MSKSFPYAPPSPIKPAIQKRLRYDVLRWARILRYSLVQAITGEPDSVLNFLGACIERFPDEFTHAHGREIFAWQLEVFHDYVKSRAAHGDPEALKALAFADRACARGEAR